MVDIGTDLCGLIGHTDCRWTAGQDKTIGCTRNIAKQG